MEPFPRLAPAVIALALVTAACAQPRRDSATAAPTPAPVVVARPAPTAPRVLEIATEFFNDAIMRLQHGHMELIDKKLAVVSRIGDEGDAFHISRNVSSIFIEKKLGGVISLI